MYIYVYVCIYIYMYMHIYIYAYCETSPIVLKLCFTHRKNREVCRRNREQKEACQKRFSALRLYQKEGAFLAEPRYIREDQLEHIGTLKSFESQRVSASPSKSQRVSASLKFELIWSTPGQDMIWVFGTGWNSRWTGHRQGILRGHEESFHDVCRWKSNLFFSQWNTRR